MTQLSTYLHHSSLTDSVVRHNLYIVINSNDAVVMINFMPPLQFFATKLYQWTKKRPTATQIHHHNTASLLTAAPYGVTRQSVVWKNTKKEKERNKYRENGRGSTRCLATGTSATVEQYTQFSMMDSERSWKWLPGGTTCGISVLECIWLSPVCLETNGKAPKG